MNASRSIIRALQTARAYEIKAHTPGLPIPAYRQYTEWAKEQRQKAKRLYDQGIAAENARRQARRQATEA